MQEEVTVEGVEEGDAIGLPILAPTETMPVGFNALLVKGVSDIALAGDGLPLAATPGGSDGLDVDVTKLITTLEQADNGHKIVPDSAVLSVSGKAGVSILDPALNLSSNGRELQFVGVSGHPGGQNNVAPLAPALPASADGSGASLLTQTGSQAGLLPQTNIPGLVASNAVAVKDPRFTLNVADGEIPVLSRLNGEKLFLLQKRWQSESHSSLPAPLDSAALNDSPAAMPSLSDGFKGRIQVPMQIHFSNPQWAQGLAEQTATLIHQRISSAEIQLDPPELGPLQVRIQVHQDQASVNFVSANPQVREALDLGLLRLKDMLQEQGMQLVDSGVSDQSGGERREQAEGESSPGFSDEPQALNPDMANHPEPVTVMTKWGIDDFA